MKMTHSGKIIGSGTLYPTYTAKLRETKTMWITEQGTKWRKRDGYCSGVQYPRQHLDLTSVKPLESKALLIRVDELTINDFCMSADEYMKLLNTQHDKTPVTVLGVGCEVDGEWEHDYHDIQLADGTVYDAISGYHLQPITA